MCCGGRSENIRKLPAFSDRSTSTLEPRWLYLASWSRDQRSRLGVDGKIAAGIRTNVCTGDELVQLTIPIPPSQDAVRLPPGVFDWSEGEFFQFCQANRDLRIERSTNGEIKVMSPAGGYAGYQSGKVFSQLERWADQDGTGVAFDSSTGLSYRMALCARPMPPGRSWRA